MRKIRIPYRVYTQVMSMKSRASSVKQRLGACALVMAGLALNPLCAAMAAEATQQASALFEFNQPAKPLPQALNDFSRLTGLSVVYTDEAPLGLQAPAIKGRMSAAQALQQLLAQSGFNARRTDASTFALEPRPTAGALNLGATSITAQTPNDTSYQPPAITSVMRGTGSSMEIPQTINVVAAQVIRDQAPRNLDDALNNVSGITQGNTLGSTQDSVMKRGFGDNRDGSIMRDGMPLVQGRAMNATTELVEVLKGPA